MNSKEAIREWTDRYLANELSTEERSTFEARWQSEPEVAEVIEQHFRERYAGQVVAGEALKARLKKRYAATEKKTVRINFGTAKRYLMAASLLLLVALGYRYFFYTPHPKQMAQLYEENYEVPATNENRGTEPDQLQKWHKANNLYNEKKYAQAAGIFEQLALKDTSEAPLYLGICYLELGNTHDAIQQFSRVDDNSMLFLDALWYETMAYLKLEDKAKAAETLKKLEKRKSTYRRKKVRRILKALKQLENEYH